MPRWTLKYQQRDQVPESSAPVSSANQIIVFPEVSNDLVFDETMLVNVKEAWQKLMGSEAESEDFLVFEDRNQVGDEEEEES